MRIDQADDLAGDPVENAPIGWVGPRLEREKLLLVARGLDLRDPVARQGHDLLSGQSLTVGRVQDRIRLLNHGSGHPLFVDDLRVIDRVGRVRSGVQGLDDQVVAPDPPEVAQHVETLKQRDQVHRTAGVVDLEDGSKDDLVVVAVKRLRRDVASHLVDNTIVK